MQTILELITGRVADALTRAGYDSAYARVTVSNRPDLCQYQCNGALAAAKQYHKAPLQIAGDIAALLACDDCFSLIQTAAPGFLNLNVSDTFLTAYIEQMRTADRFGLTPEPSAKTVVVDYGGPNVAKPLHIGHLRSAIIGESVKRTEQYFGNHVIGDIHMGDWGLQMGLIIAELKHRQPTLCYFDESFSGEAPAQAPFTITDLEEIYPAASAKAKQDEKFAAQAHDATVLLQQGKPGYRALWEKIMEVSVADLRKNYDRLDVHFESWLGESDAQPDIAPMLARMEQQGILTSSEGARVVQVQLPGDTKEMPPCILVKSDGATLYATTDLATIVQRERDFHPDKLLYLTDKRQNLHFEQVFRAARKAGLVRSETELMHIGFGTMNGKDGKPFKTREGGVMRLERLIAELTDFVRQKVCDNQLVEAEQVEQTTACITMAALKYGDLSNQPTKDYIFDMDRFAAFEGNTGPYILYTIVRIKSILAKFGAWDKLPLQAPLSAEARELMLSMTRFSDALCAAYRESCPSYICAYIYELAGYANKFYHETRILTEPDESRKQGYIALIALAKRMLETCIRLLGFEAPDKM